MCILEYCVLYIAFCVQSVALDLPILFEGIYIVQLLVLKHYEFESHMMSQLIGGVGILQQLTRPPGTAWVASWLCGLMHVWV